MGNPIISLLYPEKEDLKLSKYIDHTCHNTLGVSNSGYQTTKIPRFNSDIPEEWIIFVDLVQKALLEQNVTTDPPMTESMEIVL